jgi:ribosomal protein S18 acetylase RimI-like enzyme
VVTYRRFRNTDPPGLAEIWNESLTGRGAVALRHSSPLETYVFAKLYFDPAGLIVAIDDDKLVGFAHAGLGPNADQTGTAPEMGIICKIAVRPSYRRRGIGSELLRRCEEYLARSGSPTIYAGPMAPYGPFYFGVYGGSCLPGILVSDAAAEPFLLRHGYQVHETRLVLQRSLTQPLNSADARFPSLRRQFELRVAPRAGRGTWWQESMLGPVEPVEFRLEDKATNRLVGHTAVWEMDGFSWRWNQPAVGILEIEVSEDRRRQGLAKYLLTQMLHYLQDQFFGLAEVQIPAANEPAINLFRGVGFAQVDVGRQYKKT